MHFLKKYTLILILLFCVCVSLPQHGEVVTDVFIRSGDLVACDRKVGSYDAMANYATLWAPAEYGNGDELWELEVSTTISSCSFSNGCISSIGLPCRTKKGCVGRWRGSRWHNNKSQSNSRGKQSPTNILPSNDD